MLATILLLIEFDKNCFIYYEYSQKWWRNALWENIVDIFLVEIVYAIFRPHNFTKFGKSGTKTSMKHDCSSTLFENFKFCILFLMLSIEKFLTKFSRLFQKTSKKWFKNVKDLKRPLYNGLHLYLTIIVIWNFPKSIQGQGQILAKRISWFLHEKMFYHILFWS